MADNPLLPGALDMLPEVEQEQRWELMEANEASLLELQERKAGIEQKRARLGVESKEKNLDAVEKLNRNINQLMDLVSDPVTAAGVAAGIESGKDYNEFVKAVASVAKLRDDLLDKTMDMDTGGGKKKKIAVAFQSQGVQVMVGVETDE